MQHSFLQLHLFRTSVLFHLFLFRVLFIYFYVIYRFPAYSAPLHLLSLSALLLFHAHGSHSSMVKVWPTL
jgi:hypothetical protein